MFMQTSGLYGILATVKNCTLLLMKLEPDESLKNNECLHLQVIK